jgi:signal transduction histidine kinase
MVRGLQHKLASQNHPSSVEADRIGSLIEEIMHHTHDLAHQFSSLDVQGEDLRADLQRLADNAHRMFNTPCLFSLNGDVPVLPEHTLLQLHKIAQEAVSNAIKHGKATEVQILVCCDVNSLQLTVRNDGRPFSVPESSRNRMGLRIMKYRANTVGAALEIKPAPKGGAIVTCSLPIRTHANGGADQPSRRAQSRPAMASHEKGI